ncbi:PRTase-like protein [Pluteus cervinus]|uniref:PRTase-like protein n=1 Tax=Pluteus cervinus TaxID=181527 RepID=A0ACD3B161_9AGAR|nr:PRTase-like protein [Pluteus cervinus]
MVEGAQVQHLRVTYNDIHNLIRKATPKIAEFDPDLMVAIGGGGFFPARVMRTFLRGSTGKKTLQIQAIGLSLYEPLLGTTAEQIGNEVIRTQWLGPDAGKLLLGKRVLIVDEVDDTRKTLHYALSELRKDVLTELNTYPVHEQEKLLGSTKFAVFVVHNKLKGKLAELPAGMPYYSGADVGDVWLDYPWEATDIEEHDRLAALDRTS